MAGDPYDVPDPYGTAGLTEAVRTAWSASPARFREDANAEEDLARGGYRDRVVVELAQNAADAAVAADEPGRLLLRLAGEELLAANTGAPLTAHGVAAISSLRASAKRGAAGTAGRFGVGFAAVRAVADEIAIVSAAGGVRWSLTRTRDLAATLPGLAEELARRGNALPVLRLPEVDPEPGPVPAGYATAVRLRLRDEAARALVEDLLAAVDDALLLVLPALTEVRIEVPGAAPRRLQARATGPHVLIQDGDRVTRWRRVGAAGVLDPDLLADRPVEERARPAWSVAVAVPVDAQNAPLPLPPALPRVLHAPTPTDEPLSLPALVVASVPVEPSRRRTVPGRLRDTLLARAAGAYAELVAGMPPSRRLLDLVPGPLPAGEVDAVLADAVLVELRAAAWLPAAVPPPPRLRPDTAVTVPAARGAARPQVLGELVAGLVDPAWVGHPALRRLGVAEVDLADVLDALAGRRWEPARWRELYAGLAGADLEALAGLPVPLLDGRVVRGVRGALLLDDAVSRDGAAPPWAAPDALRRLGLRVIDPAAADPLLLRLGAAAADAAGLLADPAVRSAVEAAGPEDDLDELAEAVLGLLAAAPGSSVVELPWLAALPLRDADGEAAPAGELVLPGTAAADLFDPEVALPVAPDLIERWGPDVLARAGVLTTFALTRDADVPLDGTVEHDLDDETAWMSQLVAGLPTGDVPPVLAELVAVRDLDLVREEAWPAVLRLMSEDPDLRAALLSPALVLAGGTRREAPTYTAWWLARHARLGGRPLTALRTPDADPALASLYPAVEVAGIDPAVLAAAGVRTRLGPELAADLIERLADPAVEISATDLQRLLTAIADAAPRQVPPPDLVRVPDGVGTRLAAAEDVLIADAPYWAQLGRPGLLPLPPDVADRVAELLDVAMAADTIEVEIGDGEEAPVPAEVALVLPGAPATYREHDELVVAGHPVDWWVEGSTVHAATGDGLARGLAWAAGRWSARLLVAEVLRDPDRAEELAAEQLWGDQPEA